MITVLGLFASFTFFILAVIHFNWAFGGVWGFDNALPTNEDDKKVLNPRKIDSALIGIALTAFGIFYLANTDLISLKIPTWIKSSSSWIVPIVFLARAIGDTKYIGFFKKIKTTKFAKLDTKYYSPLCLLLGLITLAIKLL